MIELPLFPLNTVLFPGMPLPLQIFEERYHEMIRFCLTEDRPFGVVLIRQGTAEGGPLARPYAVGCTAVITQVEKLDQDRLFIMTVGQERFRILKLQRDRPYLIGQVELIPARVDSSARLQEAADHLLTLVFEYLEILASAGRIEFDPAQIPTEPDALGFLAATIIQVPMEKKQALLEKGGTTELIESLIKLFNGELALMRTMPRQDENTSFSLN